MYKTLTRSAQCNKVTTLTWTSSKELFPCVHRRLLAAPTYPPQPLSFLEGQRRRAGERDKRGCQCKTAFSRGRKVKLHLLDGRMMTYTSDWPSTYLVLLKSPHISPPLDRCQWWPTMNQITPPVPPASTPPTDKSRPHKERQLVDREVVMRKAA